jgi:hypothetical protein
MRADGQVTAWGQPEAGLNGDMLASAQLTPPLVEKAMTGLSVLP